MEKFAKYTIFLAVIFLTGCASVKTLDYIQDINPYRQPFHSDYQTVVESTKTVLKEIGWTVVKETDPSVYERHRDITLKNASQILLFVELEKKSFIRRDGDIRLNVLIWSSKENKTEVEIRYQKITKITLRKFYDYRDDKRIKNIFQRLEEALVIKKNE